MGHRQQKQKTTFQLVIDEADRRLVKALASLDGIHPNELVAKLARQEAERRGLLVEQAEEGK